MIKYYCDICGKEITENRVKAKIKCNVIPSPHTTGIVLHTTCLVELIGAKKLEEMQVKCEEREKTAEKRKAERMKGVKNNG